MTDSANDPKIITYLQGL